MKELVCICIFLLMSAICAIAMVVAGFVCQYRKKTKLKKTTYECGIEPFGDSKIKFDVRYFNYAVLFLIFDIETMFLYPIAVNNGICTKFIMIEIILFVLIILAVLLFVINKQFLRWL